MLDIYIRCIHCILYFFRVDPFTKKDWYDVKAPCMFVVRQIGKTLVTRTQGTSKYLKWKSYSAYDKTCDIARWLQCDLNTAIMEFWIEFNLFRGVEISDPSNFTCPKKKVTYPDFFVELVLCLTYIQLTLVISNSMGPFELLLIPVRNVGIL